MNQHDQQHQIPVAYPPQGTDSYNGQYVMAPPPMGYPTMDDSKNPPQAQVPTETTTRSGGFLRGCCAGLCCCCALDMCF